MSSLQEIEKYSSELLYQIKRCEDYFCAHEELSISLNKYNKQICIAGDFFSVTNEALLISMMIELIKLYEYSDDAISVRKLLDKCQSDPKLATVFKNDSLKEAIYNAELSAFRTFIEGENKSILDNLKERRDKYYMHNDGQAGVFFNTKSLIYDHPLSFDEAQLLITKAKSFCSSLYKLVTDKEWEPRMYQGACLEHHRDFSGLQTLLGAVSI